MMPLSVSERSRHVRSASKEGDDSYLRHSPSNTGRRHDKRKESPDERSKLRKDYKMDGKSHRRPDDDDFDDRNDATSPPPAKRRRRSEERADDPEERYRKHDRSRSPYQRDKRRDRDGLRRRRSRSRDGARKAGRGHRRHDSLSRSRSPAHRNHHRDYSASPPRRRDRRDHQKERSHSNERSEDQDLTRRSRAPLPSQQAAFRGTDNPSNSNEIDKPIEKEKPNFKPTGLLAQEANTVVGTKIVLKYNEPPEARKPPPSQKWTLYIFKGDDIIDEIPLYTQSCWLLGREQAVADVWVEHPSASKQHCVVQFRHSVKTNEFGDKTNIVRPYIIDLESANGTVLNGERIKDSRYYEVRDKDMVKIGQSEREYVFMLPGSG